MNTDADRRHENLAGWTKARAPYMFVGLALLLVVCGLAFARYEGTLGPFLLFNVVYLALMLLAIPRPRSYVYTFLSLFLFLGFWSKFVAHAIVGYAFVEPVGAFDGSQASWDRALVVASCGALGVVLARGVYLIVSRRYPSVATSDSGKVPSWYPRLRWPVWAVSLVLVLALNVWNLFAGFYQIGLEPRLILPFYLNVLTAWLINFGFALWIAALVHWEILVRRGLTPLALLAPLAEGLVSSTSTLSRKAYLFHVLPYALVLFERRRSLWRKLRGRTRAALLLLFVLGFMFSLVAVSAYRLYAYYPTSPAAPDGAEVTQAPPEAEGAQVQRQRINGMARQVLGLSVDRWTGLEGVLAVSSHPNLGWDRMVEVIGEDPTKGEGSTYQIVAGANEIYAESDRTTFMTLPGIVAILSFSGSLIVVTAGMFLVASALMLLELIYFGAIGNPFVASVAGLAIATTAVELNFPLLTIWFFAEIFITLLLIWAAQAMLGTVIYETAKESS